MPFVIVRNDIANVKADAIVNTANPQPVIGSWTDASIHEKAGPELLKARQQIGPIPVGSAAVTPAFNLQAKFVIHTVGPIWVGGSRNEEKLLRSCYDSALALAAEYKCRSVAFPLISSGNYGFPKDKALSVAISAFSAFLLNNEMMIYLVVFDGESYKLSEKLFQNIAVYIDENYVESYEKGLFDTRRSISRKALREEACVCEAVCPCAPMPASLEDILREEDAGFTETLLKLIDESGKKDSQVYKKAGLTKQHFSKIRNNPHYKPTKPTAVALAVALELDLEGMKDLIGRAGYALSNSSKFDLIIRYFVENRIYDVVQINMALYEFDQPLLTN